MPQRGLGTVAMPELSPRGRLVRDAILYTPPFVVLGAVLVLMLLGWGGRPIIGMVIVAFLVFLFGYQSVQSLRDLGSRPRDVEGPIARRWTKRDGFVWKSQYITVQRSIFRIPVEMYLDIKVGDTVRVHAYPHTGLVIAVERLAREAPAVAASDAALPAAPARAAKGRERTLRTARVAPRERRPAGQQEGDAPPDE